MILKEKSSEAISRRIMLFNRKWSTVLHIGLHIIITNILFSELSDSLNEITNNYDNLVVIGIDAWHRRFEGAELQLPKNVCFIKICSWYGRRLTFCHLFLPTHNMLKKQKIYITMTEKRVTFLYKTISTYWCTTN